MPPAKRSTKPSRALLLVVIVLAVLYGGMAIGQRYSPALGIDLRGGTTVTLTAKSSVAGGKITQSDLKTAKNIMLNRVNGLGVSGATVQTEGSRNIVITVPGKNSQSALAQVGQTALLSIRQVYETNAPGATGTDVPDTSSTTVPLPSPSPSASGSAAPSPSATGSAAPSPSPSAAGSSAPAAAPSGSPGALGDLPGASGSSRVARARAASFVREASTSPSPSGSPSPAASGSPSATPSPAATSGSSSSQPETTPSQAELDAYANLDCSKPANQTGDPRKDDPNKFIATCGAPDGSPVWYKYLLHPTLIPGKDVATAAAQLDQQSGTQWTVLLTFHSSAASKWSTFTAGHIGTLTAIVLDGNVYSAEVIQGAITGPTQISGSFTHKQASDLADVLKYGALPLSFDEPTARTISATLGDTQLKAGLLAGAIGLALVILYSFFYYRGLSVVTVTSLALSAAIQYPTLVILGKAISYTLSLAGVAGLIVAVGVTADSFVVFFERLRDEVREGNSLRTAVEKGWVRARRTIVSADLVSLIAAAILYWLAIGDVRGFAFTLGLSTIVDLFIVFYFTKPLLTLLGNTRFFGNGHRLSGLDPERLGVSKIPGTAVTRRVAPARRA